jgi:hypothetical protein
VSYTLLQLVDQVSGELGLTQPVSVMGSVNNQTTQLLALTQRLGKDLLREFEWQGARKIYVFQTDAVVTTSATLYGSTIVNGLITNGLSVGMVVSGVGIPPYAEVASIDSIGEFSLNVDATTSGSSDLTFATQDYSLPSDYDRMVPDSSWDRTNHWMNLGAKSSQEWQTLQGGIASTGPRERYRIYRNKLRFFPAPTAVYIESFEYVSKYWTIASGGTEATKESFTVDTDTCIFKDALMAAGLKYYFLKAKRLDYGVEQAEFLDLLSTCKAQDEPLPIQSLNPIAPNTLITGGSIPDGSWSF